jgi:hypothetical protein
MNRQCSGEKRRRQDNTVVKKGGRQDNTVVKKWEDKTIQWWKKRRQDNKVVKKGGEDKQWSTENCTKTHLQIEQPEFH